MPAVSDTSPILGLAIIGHLNLLQEQFGEIYIPQAVLAELKVTENFQGATVISQALADGWLKSSEIQNKPLAQSLLQELDLGEAEAITLAVDLGFEMIVMDEKDRTGTRQGIGIENGWSFRRTANCEEARKN